MKAGTVIIPHSHTTRWTQIAVHSLLSHKNGANFDILIIDNSMPHPSIKGITETALNDPRIRVIQPDNPPHTGHQLALDQAIDLVETPWFIAWETDVRVMRDGWLDWMLSHVPDAYTAIVGWYWATEADDNRHYISPAGALYRTSVLKMLKEECLRNKDLACCWGRKMNHRVDFVKEYPQTAGMLIPSGHWGPFCESRGFGNVYPFPRDHWVPEPGNWVYNRCVMQWECVHLPGELVVNDEIFVAPSLGLPHKYAYIGPSEAEAYYIHYWAGTVSHNFDKHLIYEWDVPKLEWWLKREHRIWNEVVPEPVRKQTIEMGLVRTYEEEYAYALTRVKKQEGERK